MAEPTPMPEVPADLLRAAQELLAREGLEALQAATAKAMAESAEASAPTCKKAHVLKRQAAGMTDWISGVKCDACGGSAFAAGDMWSCRACDYDECGICAARIKCPAGHALAKKGAGIGDWISGMTCDVCKKNPWSSSGSVWSCRECDYDQCGKCMEEKSMSTATTATPSPQNSAPPPVPSPAANAQLTIPVGPPSSSSPVAAPAVPAQEVPVEKAPEPAAEKSSWSFWGSKKTSAEPVAKASVDPAAQPPAPAEPEEPPPDASPVPVIDAADPLSIKKARDDALARKRAIESRMQADAAALAEEEEHLDSIRKKLGEADKVRQRSEELRNAIEQDKREIQQLERDNARRKEAVRQAEEAAKQAVAAQLACQAQLAAKHERCQQREQEMVDFLLQTTEEAEAQDAMADASPSGELTEHQKKMADELSQQTQALEQRLAALGAGKAVPASENGHPASPPPPPPPPPAAAAESSA